jgi:hypothetical protein
VTVQNIEKNDLKIDDSSQILFDGPGSGEISRYRVKKFMLFCDSSKYRENDLKIHDSSPILFAGPGSGQISRYSMKKFSLFWNSSRPSVEKNYMTKK